MLIPFVKSFLSTESLISHKDEWLFLLRVLLCPQTINFCVNVFLHCSQLNCCSANVKNYVFVNFHFGGIGISTLITNAFGGSLYLIDFPYIV